MNTILAKIALIFVLPILIIASISGCSEVRKLTYSEDFTYVENKEIRSLMRQMSKGVERLEQIVEKAQYSDTTQQQVISEIGKLERITARLSAGHTQTNQLFISDHIEQFNTDISTAKMFAKTTPPDYSKILEVANKCQQCHKWR
ncbi:MAG: hypothetical protein OQK98_00835 [Gammaproteobacteria bacterium]|nr:hypothetical protein [Gammaproteobacteria bacterium]